MASTKFSSPDLAPMLLMSVICFQTFLKLTQLCSTDGGKNVNVVTVSSWPKAGNLQDARMGRVPWTEGDSELYCISFLWLISQISTNLKVRANTIILQFWRFKVQQGPYWAQTKVLAGPHFFFLDSLEKTPFPHLFQLLDVSCISWLVAPSFIFKANNTSSP